MKFNFRNKMLILAAIATIGMAGVGTMSYTAFAQETPQAQSESIDGESAEDNETARERRHKDGDCDKNRDGDSSDTDAPADDSSSTEETLDL